MLWAIDSFQNRVSADQNYMTTSQAQVLTFQSHMFFELFHWPVIQGFWYFAEKKQNFAGFSGANSRKNRPISREKSHNSREKSADFAGSSREKSQNSPENRSIPRNFSRKKSNIEGFSGANSQKNRPISGPISWQISGGNFAKKQSVKNSRFRWIFVGKFR